MALTKEQVLEKCRPYSLGTGGLGNWLTENTDDLVLQKLGSLDESPLSPTQLNQLLLLGHEAGVSDGFFDFYWTAKPAQHLYDVTALPHFHESFIGANQITSLDHLLWGVRRLFTDALLCFGNVRSAYRTWRYMGLEELREYFLSRCYDTTAIHARGPALSPTIIKDDDRFLIAEMACKSYGDEPNTRSDLEDALLNAYEQAAARGQKRVKIKDLLAQGLSHDFQARTKELEFSVGEDIDEEVGSADDLRKRVARLATRFVGARNAALRNTDLYLSMISDLDVYVATSMRDRDDFRRMADICKTVFSAPRLKDLHLRYFDPTLSAASGHEDKGLIECLMVKAAKALVYCHEGSESYGKDAEAAMALSLGKPVIFLCSKKEKDRFFRDVHPLSRLIDFQSGCAVGAFVTDKVEEVTELLHRIFNNTMQYDYEHDPKKIGYIRLRDRLTKSVVRLQTNNRLLTETFWNYYRSIHDKYALDGMRPVRI